MNVCVRAHSYRSFFQWWRTPGRFIMAIGMSGLSTAVLCAERLTGMPVVLPRHSVSSALRERRLAASGDAFVWERRTAGDVRWRFGTALVEKEVRLEDGHLTLVRFTDRTARHEYVRGESDVFALRWDGREITGRSVRWVLDGAATKRLTQGELMLRLTLHTPELAVVKCYLLYPQESIVQEWVEIANRSARPGVLSDPASLELRMLQHEVSDIDFTYMVGAPLNDTRYHLYTAPLTKFNRKFEGTENEEYSPIQIYQNRMTHDAVFVGWDYIGRWSSDMGDDGAGAAHVDFRVASYRRQLAPGERIETPKAFTGVFRGDFDDLGHALLDYQYRYKWDYTRAPYFAGTEMEPSWAGSSIGVGGFSQTTLYRQVFHMVDLMREVGTDIYWRDFGWWDKEGDWDGPDWAETGRYLSRYGMQQILYIPVQDVQLDSKVAVAHPDWFGGPALGGRVLDQSRPEVVDWELRMLEARQRRWGNFQWRKDFAVISPEPDSSRMLEQDQRFRRLVQTFLDRHPGMAFHGCNSGGYDLGYEMLRLGVSWSMNDVQIDRWRGYYASYLYPPEKLEDLPDRWDPDSYDKALWRGRLWNKFPTQGETNDPEKREGIRELFDIYHYLLKQGVFGRWAWVYHPVVTGDSTDWYLERLSGDHRRGVIVPGHPLQSPITIYPKGLLPGETYDISYQEVPLTTRRLGADVMTKGISLSRIPDGELIYLNVPLHPGSTADRTPPSPPSRVTQQEATHMDYFGVELRWSPGHDDNWVSYYQIYRGGVPIAKVAKGTYYFDHALGADLAAHYAVATVDGSGNRSKPVPASEIARTAALVVDDTSSALVYSGPGWVHQTGQWVVANGTQTYTQTRGDAVSYAFVGSRVTWYGRLGPANGVAAVYLDGTLDRLVDTYDAQDMPNVAMYSRTFPGIEAHTLKIVALGEAAGADSTHRQIVVDGVQVERRAVRVVLPLLGQGIVYRGAGWTPGVPSQQGSALVAASSKVSSAMSSSVDGDQATYTITGQAVTWIGRRCATCGKADVYVDGRLETTVDTYIAPIQTNASLRADEQDHVPVFTRRWPTRGRHTLRIVVRTDVDPPAPQHAVFLNALYVEP